MAKSDSILKLRGTFKDVTYVKSPVYGDHVRAARGTHKEAALNKTLQEEVSNLTQANVPAKILKDALDRYRDHFKGGLLWQRLVSQFRKQIKSYGRFEFSKLEPVEVHEQYPFHRFLDVALEVKADSSRRLLQVTLRYSYPPDFRRSTYLNGYRFAVITIFPDLRARTAHTEIVYSPVLVLQGATPDIFLEITVPENAKDFVLCLKIEGCENGEVYPMAHAKAMRIVAGGEIIPG